MSEDEKETEQPNKIVNLVKTILEFNNQIQERKSVENTNTRSNDQQITNLLSTIKSRK